MRNARRASTLAVLPGAVAAASMALAQDYPRRPMRMIVALPPGGSTDIMGRMLAAKLGERFG